MSKLGDCLLKLGTKGRYAVMAMVDLAQSGTDKPVSIMDISLRQNISVSYLEQLFGKLRKGSQVKSVRGPGGGYILARSATQIKVLDIILAVDEPIKTTRCKTIFLMDVVLITPDVLPTTYGQNWEIKYRIF